MDDARVLVINDQYIQVITEFDGDKQELSLPVIPSTTYHHVTAPLLPTGTIWLSFLFFLRWPASLNLVRQNSYDVTLLMSPDRCHRSV